VGTILNANHSANTPWGTNTITSANILMLTGTNPILVFQSWLDIEGLTYDGVNVKISVDGGANWILVTDVTPAYNLTILGQDCWGGHSWNTGWQTFQANLSAYLGNIIRLRFELRADAGLEYAGWYIDDLVILD